MYPTILVLHSWVRWLVILAGLWAVASAASGRASLGRGRVGPIFAHGLGIQFVLGVLLYVFSPITRAAIGDMSGAMGNRGLRFWAVEHPMLMVLAVVFAHVGLNVSRRKSAANEASRLPFLWYALAMVAVLAAIPWPFMGQARPLFRF